MKMWDKIKSVFRQRGTKAKAEQQKSSPELAQEKTTEAADKSQTKSSSGTETPL